MSRIKHTTKSELIALGFKKLLAQNHLPLPIEEFRFSPPRRWRFDYSWPERKVALEVDGGVWSRGRHTRGKGWLTDTEKLNAAAGLGWRMLRCTPDQLCTPEIIQTIKQTLAFTGAA